MVGCSTSAASDSWHARPARFQSREMLVLVREMLAGDRYNRRDARHAIRGRNNDRMQRLSEN